MPSQAANPFLRWDSPDLARGLGLDPAAAGLAVFTEARRRKDRF